MTELATTQQPEQQIAFNLAALSTEQLNYLKTSIISGENISDGDITYFLGVCQQHSLNPFTKQIYGIMRKGKLSIQTGIDGFLAIAHRTGSVGGVPTPKWCGEDGVWKTIWAEKDPPVAAMACVYKIGAQHPFEAVAHWYEYAQYFYDKSSGKQKLGEMWAKMPATMLAKCALTLALRRAFPEQTQGIRTTEEMMQSENETPTTIISKTQSIPPTQITTPPAPDKVDATIKIINSTQTLENLQLIWKALPLELKKNLSVIDAKDAKKDWLSQPLPESIEDLVVDAVFIENENELLANLAKCKTATDWEFILVSAFKNAPYLNNDSTLKKVEALKLTKKLK